MPVAKIMRDKTTDYFRVPLLRNRTSVSTDDREQMIATSAALPPGANAGGSDSISQLQKMS